MFVGFVFRQRDYLEHTVETLKFKLSKDAKLHRLDNVRIMQENAELIREINELRKRGKVSQNNDTKVQLEDPTVKSELKKQRDTIVELNAKLQEKEARISELEKTVVSRPVSRERLPPIPRN